jgi:TolA-binding protein
MLGYCYYDSESSLFNEYGSQEIARTNFEELVTRFPESPFAVQGNYILGDMHFNEGTAEEVALAVPYFEAVVANADPNDPYTLYDRGVYMLAWSFYKLSEYERTLELFTELLDYSEMVFRESGKQSALRPEAIEYTAISFSDLSQKSFTFEDPDWREYADDEMIGSYELLDSLGLAGREVTSVEIAEAWFAKVGPREYEHDILVALASTLDTQAYFEQAIAVYSHLQTKDPDHPDNPDYQYQVALLYGRLPIPDMDGQQQALADLNQWYNEDSDWWTANKNNPDAQSKARGYIEQSLSSVAKDIHIMAVNTGDAELFSKAADMYREYLQRFPFANDYYEISWYLADSLYNAGRHRESAVECEQLLKMTGHPYAEQATWALFRNYDAILKAEYGKVEALPQDAAVTKQVELPNGQVRDVYALGEDHQRYVDAADIALGYDFSDPDYVDTIEENRAALMYLAGQTYYAHGDYETARERFWQVIDDHPQTIQAEYAARLIVNTYQADGDLEKVLELSIRFRSMSLGPVDMQEPEVWGDLEQGAAFKLAFQKAEAEDYQGAAEAFEAFLKQYPDSEHRNIVLYNAANNYQQAGQAEQAIVLFEQYINEYPTDERAKDLYWRIATGYASILELDTAITYYERLYKNFGPRSSYVTRQGNEVHVDAAPALYMAGFLKTGIGDHAGAARNFEEYFKQFPDAADAEQVFWLAGGEWEKVGQAEARDFYGDYISWSKGASDPNPDHLIDAHYWLVEYHRDRGDTRKEEKAWDALDAAYNRVAASGAVGPVARNRAAEGAFRAVLAMYDDFTDDEYPKKSEALTKFLLEDKVSEYEALADACLNVIQTYQDFEYSSAAIYIWGMTYLTYAELLYNVPLPDDLAKLARTDEELWALEDQWIGALSEQAMPIEEKAIARFEANLEKARKEKRSSVWIDKTIEALNDLNPSAYPLEKPEARGEADATAVIPRDVDPVNQPEPDDSSQEDAQ